MRLSTAPRTSALAPKAPKNAALSSISVPGMDLLNPAGVEGFWHVYLGNPQLLQRNLFSLERDGMLA